MDESKLKMLSRLKSIFRSFTGKDIDMSDFESRMYAQKVIEFLKEAGIAFDYRFSWYLRGPYSAVLAGDLYTIYSDENNEVLEGRLSAEESKKISELKREFDSERTDPKSMELLASIIFFMRKGETELADKIRSFKPWFSEREIVSAIERIKKSKFFVHSALRDA